MLLPYVQICKCPIHSNVTNVCSCMYLISQYTPHLYLLLLLPIICRRWAKTRGMIQKLQRDIFLEKMRTELFIITKGSNYYKKLSLLEESFLFSSSLLPEVLVITRTFHNNKNISYNNENFL